MIISVTAVAKIIEGALEGDMSKVRGYADLIAQTLKSDGEIRGYKIIASRLDGSYKEQPSVTLENWSESGEWMYELQKSQVD